jgi:hypothetical protein
MDEQDTSLHVVVGQPQLALHKIAQGPSCWGPVSVSRGSWDTCRHVHR